MKNKLGRESTKIGHVPTKETRELVNKMSIAGITQTMIGDVIGIHRETLAKHYREELNKGKSELIAEIAGLLVDKCRGGDTSSIMFFLKTQGRWSETVKQEHGVDVDNPLAALIHEISGNTLSPKDD